MLVNLRTICTVNKSILDPISKQINIPPYFIYNDEVVVNPVDGETLVSELLAQLGNFPAVYDNPTTLKNVVLGWCLLNAKRWGETIKTLCFEYNPISNYDRVEQWEDSTDTAANSKNSGKGTSKGTSESINKTAGYNTENGLTVKDGINSSNNVDNTNETTVESSGNVRTVRTGRISGNVGVTTTQEMIKEEREVLSFKYYQMVIDEFKERFLILVY